VTFGPKPRKWNIRLNRKVRRKAFAGILSERLAEGNLRVVRNLESTGKTREIADMLAGHECDGRRTVLLVTGSDDLVIRASRNIRKLRTTDARSVSIHELVNSEVILLSEKALDLLKEQGIQESPEGEDLVYLVLTGTETVVHLHLACSESTSEPREGADVVALEKDRLPGAVDHILHKLHLSQVLMIPISKWRNVFDAVAFSMTENEDWQAIDAQATVELNTRDPLFCEAGDFQTVSALMRALLDDADAPEQGLMLTTTEAPLLVEVIPDGAVRVTMGNQVMADEVAEALAP
jgi:hypothetical protein